jgi:Protein of unknown function (DUF3074)
MSDTLYTALEALQPRDFTDVPLDALEGFLCRTFTSAEVIVNSVPTPQAPKTGTSTPQSNNGTNTPVGLQPAKLATSAASMSTSSLPPPSISPTHEDLKTYWGKPLRLGAKDNPLDLSVFKLPPHDKHGAWFARRSVHQGLPFDKWKKAMQREFAESISVQGGPGAGAVRGIGAERRLEKYVAKGVGKLEGIRCSLFYFNFRKANDLLVYYLSAQFPGPTAPRDFVTLLCTTEDGLSDASVPHDGPIKQGAQIPRHYMVVSIPVDHPEAPVQSPFVRGHYESVEMIREIPITPKSMTRSTANLLSPSDNGKKQRERGNTIGFAESRGVSAKGEDIDKPDDERITNALPVEWIMITRSDPGGGIPRFMVERGTPSSIAADAVKFVDWATSQDDFPSDEDETEALIDANTNTEITERANRVSIDRRRSDGSTFEPSRASDTGVIAALTSAVGTGFRNYTPESLQDGISSMLPRPTTLAEECEDSSDVSSIDSFASAEQFTTPEGSFRSPETASLASDHLRAGVTSSSSSMIDKKSQEQTTSDNQSQLEKRLSRIEADRKKVESDMVKSRKRDEERLKSQQSKEEREAKKAQERLEREKKKREEKYAKEIRKLEQKKAAEERKAEERRIKQDRRVAELWRLECDVLRERVGELQRENTLIVQKVAKLEGGKELLRQVREEMSS